VTPTVYRAAVIGTGVNGLSTAWHLLRNGPGPVALIEQFPLGHDRGSSHGKSRITRSSYHSPVYIDLVQAAHREAWPELEQAAGERLLHPSPACFFGPPGHLYRDFVDAVTRTGADVEVLPVAEGRRRFPQFRFPDAEGVLDDHTAALVAAEATLRALTELVRAGGAHVLENTRVIGISGSAPQHGENTPVTGNPGGDPLRLETSAGEVLTEKLVITAGPWTGRLLPWLAPHITPTRQVVGYFRFDGPPESFALGTFPVWAYLGSEKNGMRYGLPEFGRRGVKVARHVVSDDPHDPDTVPAEPDPEALAELVLFAREQFATPLMERVAHEFCFYSNTPTEDFVLDFHPEDPRIVIGAGFSGHGFKFGPLTGRILADLARHGRCDHPAYMRHRAVFSATTRAKSSS